MEADQPQQQGNVFLYGCKSTLMSFSVLSSRSIECPPARKVFIVSKPKVIERGRTPIALHTENLPPTKSQNPKTFSASIPNSFVRARAVEAAQKCLEAMRV